ncbi:hypothetical protein AA957_08575 [Pseudomonas trivialis]|uniref:Uncharacterized protein n=1 Tax=Pseudomonas trivialis TaxID=200450 RepID=A0A0H5APK6_9PSED|nr:hypothetical protein AA957_08575 [Pseudomonas trivialis]
MAYIKFEGLPEGTEYRLVVEGLAKYGLEVTHEPDLDPSGMHDAKFKIAEGSWARLKSVGREEMIAKLLAGAMEAGCRFDPARTDAAGESDLLRVRLITPSVEGISDRDMLPSFAFEVPLLYADAAPPPAAPPLVEAPPRGSAAWAKKVAFVLVR